jgi:hypothetical protein
MFYKFDITGLYILLYMRSGMQENRESYVSRFPLRVTMHIYFMFASVFRPLFFRLGHTLFITWGPYAAFHGMARKCHIEGSMITAV